MRRSSKKYYKKKQTKNPKFHAKNEPTPKENIITRYFRQKRIVIVAFIIILILILFGGFYIFIKTHEDFAANFADNILRPIIGTQGTVSLEAMFFNVEDQVNQLKYQMHKTTVSPIALKQYPIISAAIHMGDTTQNHQFQLDQLPSLVASSPLKGEGKWTSLINSDANVLLANTFYRPDPERPYAVVDLVKMNMDFLKIGAVAGLQDPGGKTKPGPGMVPLAIQKSNNLIAAFNGGFKQKDGYYGMIVNNVTYLPLQQNSATFVIKQNEPPEIIKYVGQGLGENIIAVRQNGPMLIENSQIATSSNAWNMQTWGLTTTNSMYTWRSGLGVTKEGNIVYACGPSLIPETLAKALLAAGAVNAMQLDINPIWVRFVLFNLVGNDKYTSHPLETAMVDRGYQFLQGNQKDFFYVYMKQ